MTATPDVAKAVERARALAQRGQALLSHEVEPLLSRLDELELGAKGVRVIDTAPGWKDRAERAEANVARLLEGPHMAAKLETQRLLEDVLAHLRGIQDGPDEYTPPAHGFTCFHCGETFRTLAGASLHFGTAGQRRRPACYRVEDEHPVRLFARAILHGDAVHREWLLEAAETFITDGTTPPPRDGRAANGA